jgi:hypothetical protein
LSFNRNKIISLDGGTTQEIFAPGSNISLLKVGQPLGVFKTYVFDGINQTGELVLPGTPGQQQPPASPIPGRPKVKDVNGDAKIDASDQIVTGNPNPKFIYGFSTNLSYRNFDLSAFFSGTYGNDIFNQSRALFENPLGLRNQFAVMADRWTATNPSNIYAAPSASNRLPVTDYFIENGSFLRCKNITLGYTLPKLKGVYNARLYVSGNNLFTVTKYSGYDPEVNTFAGSNTQIGVDNLVYPQSRSILGGIQVTF